MLLFDISILFHLTNKKICVNCNYVEDRSMYCNPTPPPKKNNF